MPKDAETPDGMIVCPICGHQSPAGSKRCENCYTSLGGPDTEEDSGPEGPSTEDEKEDIEELLQVPGVGEAKAWELLAAGFKTVKDLRNAKVEELATLKGFGEKIAIKIIEGAKSLDGSTYGGHGLEDWLSGEDDGLSEWLSGDETSHPESVAAPQEVPSSDSLAKWLSGEEQDVNVWLEETKLPEPEEKQIGPNELLAREAELIQLRETLREKVRQLEAGEFDPQATVEELGKTRAALDVERARAKELSDELENVKRGSIAVIKFIKSQQGSEADKGTLADRLASEMANRETLELKIMQLEAVVQSTKEQIEGSIAELPPEVQDLKRREVALATKEAELEAMKNQLLSKEEALTKGAFAAALNQPAGPSQVDMVQQAEAWSAKEQEYVSRLHELEAKLAHNEITLKQKEELISLSGGPGKGIDKEVLAKLEEAQRMERSLALRQQEVQQLKEDLRIREDELAKLKEPLKYKEEEMLRREEDLMFREKLLQEEQKKVTRVQAELSGQDELTLKKRLEELQAEVTAKEEEIRSKEKYLAAKEEDLRLREQGVISDEIEKREADRQLELKMEKVKTGTPRLDDLLLGGMPFGANVLIYGPPFTGKEVLVNAFVAEGLKKGIPALWVITEKSPKEIREEMMSVLSGYEEYEKRGLVKYVDAYSRSMGDESKDPYTEYIESPTDYESIQKAIENAAKVFNEEHEYYRVAFRSISTLIAYLDPGTAFRFLSPVVGRRKRDRAIAMYTIEKGVHGEQEIQMIGSLMDGMIEFKVENLNTFLAIRGIGDVQSRAFIRYSATKSAVTIGSFSLDHIR
jgi:KaiC/GvpD/RAD55 family RecA-like ATPase